MRLRAKVAVVCLCLLTAAASGIVRAAESPPPKGIAEDWSIGVWQADNPTHFISGFKDEEEYENPKAQWKNPPPLSAAYLKRYSEIRKAAMEGKNTYDQGTNCSPLGIPFMTGAGNFVLMEILFKRGQITMPFEAVGGVRRIFTDGRPHPGPDDLIPTYNGHSIGHWEGRTLVVDTIGLRDDTYLEVGMPHSSQLHVIERWTQVGPDELENQVTLIDPVALTKPWKVTWRWKHQRDFTINEEFCTYSRDQMINGQTTLIGPDGKPLLGPGESSEKK